MIHTTLGGITPRRFDPLDVPLYHHVPLNQFIYYNEHKKISQLQAVVDGNRQPLLNAQTLVVYIDGVCRGEETLHPCAAFGVYFGPNSPRNVQNLLDISNPQTKYRAYIQATIAALSQIVNFCNQDGTINDVKIATDNEELVNAMCLHIERWITHHGFGWDNQPIEHYDSLKFLHDMISQYQPVSGVEVQFWLTLRDENPGGNVLVNAPGVASARALANAALDAAGVPDGDEEMMDA